MTTTIDEILKPIDKEAARFTGEKKRLFKLMRSLVVDAHIIGAEGMSKALIGEDWIGKNELTERLNRNIRKQRKIAAEYLGEL